MKKGLIDLSLSINAVDFAVDFSLHRKAEDDLLASLPVVPDAELTVHSRTCLHLFGHCQKLPHHDLSHAFAQSFAKLTLDRKLPSGALVRIKPDCTDSRGSNDPVPESVFFLGALCKRPLHQVFLKAWPLENPKFSLVDSAGSPTFMISHQAFYKLIESCQGNVTSMMVSIFPSRVDSRLWGRQPLQVIITGPPTDVAIKSSNSGPPPKSSRSKEVRLPFGLKIEKEPKKRAQGKKGPKQRVSQNPAQQPAVAKQKSVAVLSSCSETGSDSDACGSPDSKDDSSSEDDAFSNSAVSPHDDHVPVDEPAAGLSTSEPVPPTIAARDEKKEVNAAAREHRSDCAKMASCAEQAMKSTFFNKIIGFEGASIAASNRSICYHCSTAIQKGSLRLTYFYSTKRPSRFMHASCVAPFVRDDPASRRAQAVEAVSGAADSFADQHLKDQVSNLLQELLQS